MMGSSISQSYFPSTRKFLHAGVTCWKLGHLRGLLFSPLSFLATSALTKLFCTFYLPSVRGVGACSNWGTVLSSFRLRNYCQKKPLVPSEAGWCQNSAFQSPGRHRLTSMQATSVKNSRRVLFEEHITALKEIPSEISLESKKSKSLLEIKTAFKKANRAQNFVS